MPTPPFRAFTQVETARDYAMELGQKYAPIFAAFAAQIRNEAMAIGVSQVWFFTREGFFFKNAFDAYQRGLGSLTIRTSILHVSRLATFAASLDMPLSQSLSRLWSQYSKQSVRDLFVSLGVDLDAGKNLVEDQGYSLQHPVSVLKLEDTDLAKALETLVSSRKCELLEYLRQVDFPENGMAVVVDIGWRGTIQDNLAYVLPSLTLNGIYLGLLPRLNREPPNVRKSALIADLEKTPDAREMLAFALPFEMLTNAPGGSVTGYTSGLPLRECNRNEDEVYFTYTKALQDGMLCEIERIASRVKLNVLSESTLKTEALNVWRSILEEPPAFLMDALLKLEHNETFGMGESVRYGEGITWKLLAKCFSSKKARRRLRLQSDGLPWKNHLRHYPGASAALRTWLFAESFAKLIDNVLRWVKHGRRV